jgi:hypothetical protein
MAHFLSGLNKPIKRVVEFQTCNTVVELVHIAQKAERQLHDDVKPTKHSTFSSRASSAPKIAKFDLGRGMFSSGSSSNSNARSTTLTIPMHHQIWRNLLGQHHQRPILQWVPPLGVVGFNVVSAWAEAMSSRIFLTIEL